MHTDHLNSPRKVAQPTSGTLAWRWDTDPFGTAAPNQNPAGLGTFAYNLRFPGQYFMAETGLNQNWSRDYDPLTSRYVESDLIGLGGGVNTYGYAEGEPTGKIDPSGEFAFLVIPGICAAGGCEAIAAALGLSVYFSTPTGQKAANDAAAAIGELCKKGDDDPCDKVLDKGLLKKAKIYGKEHDVKADALGTYKSLSLFDLCGCNDGRVVVKAHGCRGPILAETEYRWK